MSVQSKLITLYHVTPYPHLIEADGVIAHDRSVNKIKAVWLVTKTRIPWAISHVADRHGVDTYEVYVFEVRVPRGWLVRWFGRTRHTWYCPRSVPRDRFRLVHFDDLSADARAVILAGFPF